MAKRGKKYLEAAKLVDSTKKYSLDEAVELVKKTSIVKFDATVEAAFKLNIDPRKAEQNLRGAVSLPNGTGVALDLSPSKNRLISSSVKFSVFWVYNICSFII